MDDLPDGAIVSAAGVDSIIVMSGDGTINGVARSLSGWEGTLIVLPGGTMNLLAHALHGDAPIADVARAALNGPGASTRVPIIRCEMREATLEELYVRTLGAPPAAGAADGTLAIETAA